MNSVGTPVGQEPVDTTIPEPTFDPRSTSVTSPNATMRGNANMSGTYIDPLTELRSRNWHTSSRPIVPQSWITQQPGFSTLTPEQQSSILNDLINTQGLPQSFNSSKRGANARLLDYL